MSVKVSSFQYALLFKIVREELLEKPPLLYVDEKLMVKTKTKSNDLIINTNIKNKRNSFYSFQGLAPLPRYLSYVELPLE